MDADAKSLIIHLNNITRAIQSEEQARAAAHAAMRSDLDVALRAYASTLAAGSAHDLPALFKLVRLWFSCSSDPEAAAVVAELLPCVPSRKFLALGYQIASRVGSSGGAEGGKKDGSATQGGKGAFREGVEGLVERMTAQYPHHMLYHVFALYNGDRLASGERERKGQGQGNKLLEYRVDDEKIAAAGAIIDRLRSRGVSGGHACGERCMRTLHPCACLQRGGHASRFSALCRVCPSMRPQRGC